MGKKEIILLAAAGIVTFSGAFGVTFVMKKKKAPSVLPPEITDPVASATEDAKTESAEASVPPLGGAENLAGPEDNVRGMTEKQLQGLIDDIRERMKEYALKEKDFAEQEQRLTVARQALQDDIDRLGKLNAQLVTVLADLKRQEEQLLKTRVVVDIEEQTNMKRLAATYDKMEAAQAGKILTSMMSGGQMADAVKIVYYMSERTAGKLLAEIASTRPEVAGRLSLELKKVAEKQN